MKARIYHNPRCSKSNAALTLLQARGIQLEIVDYLNDPPSKAALASLLGKLGLPAQALVRATDQELTTLLAGGARTTDRVLDLLVQQPSLLQRPIVETGDRARIGRPPERVLELLK